MIDVVHICVAMKPLDGNFAQNALKHGVAGIAIDETRVSLLADEDVGRLNARSGGRRGFQDSLIYGSGNPLPGGCDLGKGRWPANVILDGSDEVKEVFPYGKSVANIESDNRVVIKAGNSLQLGKSGIHNPQNSYGDEGSAARFFKQCESDND